MEHIVNNRTFLLGLDKIYRDAMKRHESEELLLCARRVASELHVEAGNVPVEGYYAEDQQLIEYFSLIRVLQGISEERTSEVASLREFQRLLQVTSAPLYGKAIWSDKLFPAGRDALSQALIDTMPEWNVQRLTETACQQAEKMDDFSLVGLAARAQDQLVLAATRESVVLYAEVTVGAAISWEGPTYVWKVDEELSRQARRFIGAFRDIFGEELPPPEPAHAETYWHACEGNEILGRCVRLGYNDATSPVLQYHWAICRKNDHTISVQEFWHREVWTTKRYRSTLRPGDLCPDLNTKQFTD
jgi:hypothetical protein